MKTDITKIYSHRLRNLHIMVKLLRLAPYVRCVILNGSMADGNIKQSSDIDILIIAKSGHIYTCRVAVLFRAALTGLKRSNNENKSHAGRFCFNYFLTDNFLEIPHNRGKEVDKYCAENYSKSILLWGDRKIFDRFMNMNLKWMKNILSNAVIARNRQLAMTKQSIVEIAASRRTSALAMTEKRSFVQTNIEKMLSGNFGKRLEHTLKNIQIARIKKDPAVKKYPEYIVLNDRELRFHLPNKSNN